MLTVDPHPLLESSTFVTEFPAPLEEVESPEWLRALLDASAPSPLPPPDDELRGAVRNLLRHGGFKPTGRSKPASEYLAKGTTPPINAAVDACNAVSLHSGLPISVIDLDRATPPFRLGIAPEGSRYVFNASGQELDLSGLLCLWDAEGPCGSSVKDSQRTKTHPGTRRTLTVIWGTNAAPGRAAAAERWYREILERLGATTSASSPGA